MNTLKFIETNKGYSREIEVALSDEVGIAWGGTAIARIVDGHLIPGKPAAPGIRDRNDDSSQPLSSFSEELGSDKTSTTIDAVAQLPPADQSNADKLRQIFRHNGEQLQLMETRLKAKNKLDAARRLTFLTLFYYNEVDGRDEIPRSDLNDILKRVGLYDNNAATWIGKSADLIVEREMVGLRLPGQEQAQKVLEEVLDRSVEDKWSLTSGATSRSSKSNAQVDGESENYTKNGKRKRNGFSKDVELWTANWKQSASNLNAHVALIKDCSVAEKGFFSLWAIGKVINNPDVVVSSYKLKQFLYLGLGINVDERNLERNLQDLSGQGSLLKVQKGFQLLSSGRAQAERLIGFTQGNTSIDHPSEHSSEA
ncbi:MULTISPECIES: hypothetical protein [unclassified Microcoleus]|uniref:hypothetical protein n=1 Tax=unclassified Microcoleus TaxID=2642155 RepID=UPI002FD08F48